MDHRVSDGADIVPFRVSRPIHAKTGRVPGKSCENAGVNKNFRGQEASEVFVIVDGYCHKEFWYNTAHLSARQRESPNSYWRNMSKPNQQIRLPDGRMLGFNEHGSSNGSPLFYFHGTPSSRVEFPLFGSEEMLQALNVRLIAADRPGSGLSDFQPNRRIMDWPKDVVALADHLKINRFSVLGYSGGGVYALACALAIPEHIIKAGVASGTAPFTHPGLTDTIPADNLRFFAFSHEKPWLSRMFLNMMGIMTRLAPKQIVTNALTTLPEPDQKMMASDPEFQKGMGYIFSCTAEHKKCCKKYKEGKRCKKCPGRKK